MNKSINTRFAPSPTGHLHIGGTRTALFSWVYARKNQGKFFLRIEDTDLSRSTIEATQSILDGMNWLGLNIDKTPYYQTQHLDEYNKVIDQMIKENSAYRCYCSFERLDRLRENQILSKEKPRYDRHCRYLSDVDKQNNTSKAHVVRFKNPKEGSISWIDAVKGKITVSNCELDDLIIKRTDGTPTYNFCAVVDDIKMRITHVIRGDDHINNTPRQINLYHALKSDIPIFAHIPMIINKNKKKLSKRSKSMSIIQLKDEGYLKQAVINYLIRLGWSHKNQEIFSINEILNFFDLSKIKTTPATFNFEKLDWLNQYYMCHLPVDEVAQELAYHFQKQGLDVNKGPEFNEVIPIMVKKVKTLKALTKQSACFYHEITGYDKESVNKYLVKSIIPVLKDIKNRLKEFSKESWKDECFLNQFLRSIAKTWDLKMSEVGMPLRILMTGFKNPLSIGLILRWLDRDRVIKRLEKGINFINS